MKLRKDLEENASLAVVVDEYNMRVKNSEKKVDEGELNK